MKFWRAIYLSEECEFILARVLAKHHRPMYDDARLGYLFLDGHIDFRMEIFILGWTYLFSDGRIYFRMDVFSFGWQIYLFPDG